MTKKMNPYLKEIYEKQKTEKKGKRKKPLTPEERKERNIYRSQKNAQRRGIDMQYRRKLTDKTKPDSGWEKW